MAIYANYGDAVSFCHIGFLDTQQFLSVALYLVHGYMHMYMCIYTGT